MFETAVQEKHTGVLWGIIMGAAALLALLAFGYASSHKPTAGRADHRKFSTSIRLLPA